MSPGYPGLYPNNRDCLWLVSVTPGKHIQFTFGVFNLHGNCSEDYLVIVHLNPNSGSNIDTARYCGSQQPAPYLTESHRARVNFHSDGRDSSTGFLLTYAARPGNTDILINCILYHNELILNWPLYWPTQAWTLVHESANVFGTDGCIVYWKSLNVKATLLSCYVASQSLLNTFTVTLHIWHDNSEYFNRDTKYVFIVFCFRTGWLWGWTDLRKWGFNLS